jgi:predicted O-methyltransferase YrrM
MNKKYNFSNDWVTHNTASLKKNLCQFKGKPNIAYLEIGVWEGRSLIWMFENILTHDTSRAMCIDLFPRDLKERFLANLYILGLKNKVKIMTGKSQFLLRQLPPDSFDIIFLDGSHVANDVLADAVYSWPLLKKGGLLIFDDYLWKPHIPIKFRPKIAVKAFVKAYGNQVDAVHCGYQIFLKKRKKFRKCQ